MRSNYKADPAARCLCYDKENIKFHMLYQIVEVFGIDKYLQSKEIYVNGKAVDGRLIDVLNTIRVSGFALKTHIQVDNSAEKYTFEKQ